MPVSGQGGWDDELGFSTQMLESGNSGSLSTNWNSEFEFLILVRLKAKIKFFSIIKCCNLFYKFCYMNADINSHGIIGIYRKFRIGPENSNM